MYNYLSVRLLLLSILVAYLYHPKESTNDFTSLDSSNSVRDIGLEPARILLLTAHPDDECLFFAPTILSLIAQGKRLKGDSHRGNLASSAGSLDGNDELPSQVYSLCLSTGDADGLGEIRKGELQRSLDILGVEEGRRWIVDHPELQDNITAPWDATTISTVVNPYVIEHRITTILTFDYGGISGHPNHRSLPKGVSHLIASSSPSSAPRLYTLISLPSVTKYSGLLAPLLAKVDLHRIYLLDLFYIQLTRVLLRFGFDIPDPESNINLKVPLGAMPVFVSGFKEYFKALEAMRAHGSQLVWFRWLYVLFSRYMWVNEWIEIRT